MPLTIAVMSSSDTFWPSLAKACLSSSLVMTPSLLTSYEANNFFNSACFSCDSDFGMRKHFYKSIQHHFKKQYLYLPFFLGFFLSQVFFLI